MSFDEMSTSKPVATVFLNGDAANRCKIWIGHDSFAEKRELSPEETASSQRSAYPDNTLAEGDCISWQQRRLSSRLSSIQEGLSLSGPADAPGIAFRRARVLPICHSLHSTTVLLWGNADLNKRQRIEGD